MQCWSPKVSWSDDRVRHTYPGHQEELVDEVWAWMEGIVVLCLSAGSARGGGVKRIDWGKILNHSPEPGWRNFIQNTQIAMATTDVNKMTATGATTAAPATAPVEISA